MFIIGVSNFAFFVKSRTARRAKAGFKLSGFLVEVHGAFAHQVGIAIQSAGLCAHAENFRARPQRLDCARSLFHPTRVFVSKTPSRNAQQLCASDTHYGSRRIA
jgi:hypothetical protein